MRQRRCPHGYVGRQAAGPCSGRHPRAPPRRRRSVRVAAPWPQPGRPVGSSRVRRFRRRGGHRTSSPTPESDVVGPTGLKVASGVKDTEPGRRSPFGGGAPPPIRRVGFEFRPSRAHPPNASAWLIPFRMARGCTQVPRAGDEARPAHADPPTWPLRSSRADPAEDRYLICLGEPNHGFITNASSHIRSTDCTRAVAARRPRQASRSPGRPAFPATAEKHWTARVLAGLRPGRLQGRLGLVQTDRRCLHTYAMIYNFRRPHGILLAERGVNTAPAMAAWRSDRGRYRRRWSLWTEAGSYLLVRTRERLSTPSWVIRRGPARCPPSRPCAQRSAPTFAWRAESRPGPR